MPDHLRVNGIAGRVAERQKVNRVEHVGLAHTILANQTINLRREVKRGRSDILVVDE